jgi:hypothetical protein
LDALKSLVLRALLDGLRLLHPDRGPVDRLVRLRVLMLARYLKEQLGGSVVMREKVWRQLPLFDPLMTYKCRNW